MNMKKIILTLVVFCSTGVGVLKPIPVCDDPALQVGLLIQGLAAIGTTAAQCSANNLAYDETPANQAKFNQLKLLARLGKLTNDCAMLWNSKCIVDKIHRVAIATNVLPLIVSDFVNLLCDAYTLGNAKYATLTPEQVKAAEETKKALSIFGLSPAVALNICAGTELASNLAFITHAALRSGVEPETYDQPAQFNDELLAIMTAGMLARIAPYIIDGHIKNNTPKKVFFSAVLALVVLQEVALVMRLVQGDDNLPSVPSSAIRTYKLEKAYKEASEEARVAIDRMYEASNEAAAKKLYHAAQRSFHSDRGGSVTDSQSISAMWAVLKEKKFKQ
jgi:hypothetical protein